MSVIDVRKKAMVDEIPNTNEIEAYFYCSICLGDMRAEADKSGGKVRSPAAYNDISAGWTERGFQVWCNRHGVNIIHVDFEGVKHKANTTRFEPKPI